MFIEYRNNPSLTSLVSSSFFIIWALIVTAAASSLIVYQNSISEKSQRVRTAENLQQDADSSGTFLLRMAFSGFTDDFLRTNFYKFQTESLSSGIKDSLIKQMTAGFSNKYITHIYFFSNKNQLLFNTDSTSYDIINSVVENKGMQTSLANVWYFKTVNSGLNYIYKKQVFSDSVLLGSVFVLIQSKSVKNNALVPELFKQVNDVTTQVDKGYAFGICRYLFLSFCYRSILMNK